MIGTAGRPSVGPRRAPAVVGMVLLAFAEVGGATSWVDSPVPPGVDRNLVSFRAAATGGALLDDLEFDQDPTQGWWVTGRRAYTALTNAVTGAEELLGSATARTLFAGASAGVRGWSPALRWFAAIEHAGEAEAPSVGFDADGDGEPESGTVVWQSTHYRDVNADGTFDVREDQALRLENAAAWRRWRWWANIGWDWHQWRVGVHWHHRGSGSDSRAAGATLDSTGTFLTRRGYAVTTTTTAAGAASGTRRQTRRNLANSRPLGPDIREVGNFNTADQAPAEFIEVAVARGRYAEWRYGLELFWGRQRLRVADTFDAAIDRAPDPHDLSIEASRLQESRQALDEQAFRGLGLTARCRRWLVDPGRGRAAGAPAAEFVEASLGYRQAAVDLEGWRATPFALDATYAEPAGRRVTERYRTDAGDARRGDGFWQEATAGCRLHLRAGRRAWFGLAPRLGWERYDERQTVDVTDRRIYRFDDGDLTPADADDFVETQTQHSTSDRRRVREETILELPAAVEVVLHKRLTLRLGGTHRLWRRAESTRHRTLDASPPVIITEFGDGRVTQTAGVGFAIDSFERASVAVGQSTEFTYGLGWAVVSGVDLDVLMFLENEDAEDILDLTFWRGLRLSATIQL